MLRDFLSIQTPNLEKKEIIQAGSSFQNTFKDSMPPQIKKLN